MREERYRAPARTFASGSCGSNPMARAVAGISCKTPTAPAFERAVLSNWDSARARATRSESGRSVLFAATTNASRSGVGILQRFCGNDAARLRVTFASGSPRADTCGSPRAPTTETPNARQAAAATSARRVVAESSGLQQTERIAIHRPLLSLSHGRSRGHDRRLERRATPQARPRAATAVHRRRILDAQLQLRALDDVGRKLHELAGDRSRHGAQQFCVLAAQHGLPPCELEPALHLLFELRVATVVEEDAERKALGE